MAVSLNSVNNTVSNHETRIKKLENQVSSGPSPTVVATNIFGSCLQVGKLYIQGGRFNNGGSFSRTITFPKAFPSKIVMLACNNQPGPSSTYSTSTWTISDTNYRIDGKPDHIYWIAIGYLISNRILNHAYVCIKSLRDFKVIFQHHFSCLTQRFTREVIRYGL